jgi:hypothetical protein
MRAFDERWKECAKRSQEGAGESVPELSDALVKRVLARAWAKQPASIEAVWVALGWRTLAVVIVVMACSFVLETRADSDDSQLDRPAVEEIVADEFWML